MPTLPPSILLEWAAEQLNGDVERCTGLREGGGPWLLETRGPGPRRAVLRTAPTGSSQVETEALTWATQHHLPVPGLLAATTLVGRSAQLLEAVNGSSAIPEQPPSDRLHALGQVAARIAQVPAPSGLPERTRPIAGEDFAALRRQGPERALLSRAEEVLASYRHDRRRFSADAAAAGEQPLVVVFPGAAQLGGPGTPRMLLRKFMPCSTSACVLCPTPSKANGSDRARPPHRRSVSTSCI